MKYRNVLCVYPYKKELKTIGFLPPIGIEYVASAIEDLVESIKIIDLRHEDEPVTAFIDENTDLVLVSHQWDAEEEAVKDLINSIPDGLPVIVGGRYATEHVDHLFEQIPRIDAIARGDGEEIAKEIVQNGVSSDIDGLSFRSNGRIIHNRNRLLEPVRSDFYPNRKLRRYNYTVAIDEFTSDIAIDVMQASRGCPFNCTFCDFNFNPLGEKRKWSVRTPESVVEEIKTIDAKIIGFADNIFTADMDWVERVCDLILSEKIDKKFIVNARLEIAKRPDVLVKMQKAGFMAFLLGVESAQDKTLASMNKGFTTAKVRQYFDVLRQFDFICHCYFIVGNLGECREEILDIVPYAQELGVDTLGLSVLRATRYSPLRTLVKQHSGYHIDQESGKVYSDRLSVEDLQQLRRDVNASFFTIPALVRILRKLIRHELLTFGRVHKIAVYAARRKIKKIAARRGIRMGKNVRAG